MLFFLRSFKWNIWDKVDTCMKKNIQVSWDERAISWFFFSSDVPQNHTFFLLCFSLRRVEFNANAACYECLSENLPADDSVCKCVGCRALNGRVRRVQWPCGIWRRLQFQPSSFSHTLSHCVDVRPDQTGLNNRGAGEPQTFSNHQTSSF